MTRRQTRAYGVVTPSSRQPLLEAMLRVFGWLVSNVVSPLSPNKVCRQPSIPTFVGKSGTLTA